MLVTRVFSLSTPANRIFNFSATSSLSSANALKFGLYKILSESSQTGRKYCGKWINCWLGAISPFPTVFSNDLLQTHKNQGLFGKGLIAAKKTLQL